MQKRETFHRSWIEIVRRTVLVIMCTALPPPTGDAATVGHAWIAGRSGAMRPGEIAAVPQSIAQEAFTAAVLSCSNPYSIGGLFVTQLSAGHRSPGYAAWLDWLALRHSLYREDRLTVIGSLRLFRRRLAVTVEPSFETRCTGGFGREHAAVATASVSLCRVGPFGAGIEGRFERCDDVWRRRTTCKFSVEYGLIAVVVNRSSHETGDDEVRLGIEAAPGGGVLLLSGCRLDTDEISAGVLLVGHRYILCLSIEWHPELGETANVGVGWRWGR